MAAATPDSSQVQRLKPVWRAFVVRPALIASVPAGMVGAASYFFWEPLQWLIGPYTPAVPGLALLAVLLTFALRWVRYAKTRYEIRPDRIAVETGSLFRKRTVELDFENVTLVEWDSPFVLRRFYDAGHITLQEAGSAEKPAHLSCIEAPGDLYQRIGELMSARGFSMRRTERIQEETPGHLGAAVDLIALQVKLFWVVVLVVLQSLPESLTLLVGDGPSLLQLVVGNYQVFSSLVEPGVFTRIRVGAILLGGVSVVLVSGWLVILYLDYLARTYTLYDDVIDYVDGFLNETRRFIPLENLADTQVARPFYKRILGLSDVTLSSQGAENDVVFKSTPNGPAFAESVERLVERTPDLEPPSAERSGSPGPGPGRSREAPEVDLTLEPSMTRAALRGVSFLSLALVFAVPVLVAVVTEGAQSVEIGPFAAAGLAGLVLVAGAFGTAAAAAGAIWWMVRASATDFAFDGRGAHRTFDLISKNEQRFASERITSVTILRNPLDWIAGTMTLRFRSIGSDEDLDFWGIEHNSEVLAPIRGALGLARSNSEGAISDITPSYTLGDGLRAYGPLYGAVVAAIAAGAAAAAYLAIPHGTAYAGVFGALCLVIALVHQAVRAIYHGRIRGELADAYLEIAGGIIRRYRHLAPLRHVKAVESLRYPGSDAGRLTFKTAGFPIAVGHLPDLESLHERVDRRLGLEVADEHGRYVALKPGAGTEALRWSWTLLFGIGIVVVPYVAAYYRRMDYTIEPGRLVADGGIYFDRRTTVLFERVDHIESNRMVAHWFSDSHDIRIFTVGSRVCDLVFRSISRETGALALIRERLAFDEEVAER